MREALIEVIEKAMALQKFMDALKCPELTDVPSMAQVIVWAQGKIESGKW